jgi:hypothetical protein
MKVKGIKKETKTIEDDNNYKNLQLYRNYKLSLIILWETEKIYFSTFST